MAQKYSFVQLQLGNGVENLVSVLENLMPSTVQMLNLLQVKMRRLFSPERVPYFKFFSYEPEVGSLHDQKDAQISCSDRDWNTLDKPLFLVCIINTKYIIKNSSNFSYTLMYSRETPSPDDSDLISAFSSLFDFKDKDDIVFGTMDIRYVPFIEKVTSLNNRNMVAYPNWTMFLDKTRILRFEKDLESSDTNFAIRPLSPDDHAPVINSAWKFGSDGALIHVNDQIRYSPSAGIFLSDNTLSSPLCWTITMPTGTINALHTIDAYRRRGLAELALKRVAVDLVGLGMRPLVEIELESAASKNLMDKLGFKLAFDAVWIYCGVG